MPARATFVAGDPLRALAALGVVIFHVALLGPAVSREPGDGYFPMLGTVDDRIFSHLNLGVYVFFVLSGYLLARAFAGAYVDGGEFPAVRRYLRNRALRVLPGLVAAALVTLAVFGARGSELLEILAAPLLVQYVPSEFGRVIGVTWTLSVELGFYMLLPLGFWLLVRGVPTDRRGARVLVAVGAAAALAAASLGLRADVSAQDFDRQHWLPMTLFAFVPGILLAIAELAVVPRLRAAPRLGRRLASVLLLAGASLLGVLVAIDRPSSGSYGLLAAAGSGLIVASPLVRQWTDGTCSRMLDNRPLHWLGRRSYSLYLFHFAILGLIAQRVSTESLSSAFLLLLLVGLPGSLVAAWAGFALVERPFMTRRRPWRRERSTREGEPEVLVPA